jgi:mono/diheme cytochrome c family protein
MSTRTLLAAVAVLWLSGLGCAAGQGSPAGFALPDGNQEAGQAAFLELRCNACHTVRGLDLPPPVAEPPVPVALGGNVAMSRVTDGALVTAIIAPSHQVAPYYQSELVTSDGSSRMAEYGDVMTVRQLIDLVAFLQSHYQAEEAR